MINIHTFSQTVFLKSIFNSFQLSFLHFGSSFSCSVLFLITGQGGGGGGGGGGAVVGPGDFGTTFVDWGYWDDISIVSLLSKASSSLLKSIIVACISNPIGLNTAHFPNSSI